MESSRSIHKKYAQLLKDVSEKSYYKVDLNNRFNVYKCACGNRIKTKDIDAGTTPFMIRCDVCGNMATSSFYRDDLPDLKPTVEWYRPELKQVLKMRNKPELLEHIFLGGLLDRKISSPIS